VSENVKEDETESASGRRGFPLSLRLAFCFGGLIAVTIGTVLWISISGAKDNMLRLLGASGESIVDAMVEQVESHLAGAESQAEFIATLIAEGKLDPDDKDRLSDIMLGSLGGAPEIYGIAFIDEDLRLTGVGRLPEGLIQRRDSEQDDPGTRAWTRWARESGGTGWTGVHWIDSLGEPGLFYLQPVRVENEYRGAILSIVTLRALSEFIATISDQTELTSFILAGDRQVIAHAALQDLAVRGGEEAPLVDIETLGDPDLAFFPLEATFDLREVRPGASVDGKLTEKDGRGVVFFYRTVVGFGPEAWTFGIYSRLEQVDRSFEDLRLALLVGLAVLGLAIVAATVLSGAIARPIARLASVSGAVRRLEIDRAEFVDTSYLREVNRAADAYNAMLNALRWFEIYLPRSLVLRLMRQGASAVQSEEREVTVLFTDIVGFTDLASDLPADALARLLNAHFSLLAEAIEAEEGTIDKYIGDSVMAFWGAPADQPDHARRAVAAALDAARRIEEDNRHRAKAGEQPIRIRVGLHSGPVIVGNIGAPGRINYTLIGDTVNAAQRIEALGKEHMDESDTVLILISGETAAQLGADFDVQEVQELVLRGRRTPTRIMKLIGMGGSDRA
jgi:class 3 adenylate cyclase